MNNTRLGQSDTHDPVEVTIDLMTQTAALLAYDLRVAASTSLGDLRLVDPANMHIEAVHQWRKAVATSEALALLVEQTIEVLLDRETPSQATKDLDIYSVFATIRRRWEGRAKANSVKLSLSIEAGIPAFIKLDGNFLGRIVSGLLSDAISFSGKGDLTCHFGYANSGHLQLEITSKETHPARQMPYQVGLPSQGNPHQWPLWAPNLGAIRKAVQSEKGSIEITTNAFGDDAVRVKLLAQIGMSLPARVMSVPDLSDLNILLVDDNATDLLILSSFLELAGASVTSVLGGGAALAVLGQQSFDLAVIDTEMANITGLAVMAHIRNPKNGLQALRILALTLFKMRSNRAAILGHGAQAIMAKPVVCAVAFAHAVRATMAQPVEPKRGHAPENPQTPQTAAENARFLPKQLSDLLTQAGPQVEQEVLAQLLHDLLHTERALFQASLSFDWQNLRQHSHVLIALAGTIGANQLQHFAEDMNDMANEMGPADKFAPLFYPMMEALDDQIYKLQTLLAKPAPHPVNV